MFIVSFSATEDHSGERFTSSILVGGNSAMDAEAYFWSSHALSGLSDVSILSIESA